MITCKQIIEDVLGLLEDEDSWCQKHMAVDADGKPCCPTDKHADRFDIMGAIVRTGQKLGASGQTTFHAQQIVQGNLGQGYNHNLTKFNDNNTHEAVVELLERTMANFPRGTK